MNNLIKLTQNCRHNYNVRQFFLNINGENMKSKKIKEENIEIIPKCEIHKLREKENNYCICIPIINEGERQKK